MSSQIMCFNIIYYHLPLTKYIFSFLCLILFKIILEFLFKLPYGFVENFVSLQSQIYKTRYHQKNLVSHLVISSLVLASGFS